MYHEAEDTTRTPTRSFDTPAPTVITPGGERGLPVAELQPGEPQTIAKAVVAFTGALVSAITTAVSDGHVTTVEIVLAALMAIGAGAAVWATTNEPAKR